MSSVAQITALEAAEIAAALAEPSFTTLDALMAEFAPVQVEINLPITPLNPGQDCQSPPSNKRPAEVAMPKAPKKPKRDVPVLGLSYRVLNFEGQNGGGQNGGH
jgi:hypothetical protein